MNLQVETIQLAHCVWKCPRDVTTLVVGRCWWRQSPVPRSSRWAPVICGHRSTDRGSRSAVDRAVRGSRSSWTVQRWGSWSFQHRCRPTTSTSIVFTPSTHWKRKKKKNEKYVYQTTKTLVIRQENFVSRSRKKIYNGTPAIIVKTVRKPGKKQGNAQVNGMG